MSDLWLPSNNSRTGSLGCSPSAFPAGSFFEYPPETHGTLPNLATYHEVVVLDPKGFSSTTGNTFVLEELLGSGAYADVYRARWEKKGGERKTVAIKILKAHPKKHEAFKREIDALNRTKESEWIVKLLGYDLNNYWLILDYMNGGSLRRNSRLTPSEVARVALSLAKAMCFLHDSSPALLHGDLNPHNVLFHDGQLRLGDLGLTRSATTRASDLGHPRYRAPETNDGSCSKAAEVYSFGCVIYEAMSGAEVWSGLTNSQVVETAKSGRRPDLSGLHSKFPLLTDLVGSCWSVEPNKRPSFMAIVKMLEKQGGEVL